MLHPVLLVAALLGSTPDVDRCPAGCAAKAEALLRRVERVPMERRAERLLAALGKDPALGCGVVPSAHWRGRENPCAADTPDRCPGADVLGLSPELVKDLDPALRARIGVAASRLAAAGCLERAHRRLLETLALSSALARGR